MDGIEEVAQEANLVVLLGDSRRGATSGNGHTNLSYMTQLAAGRADALVLLDGWMPIIKAAGESGRTPVAAVSEESFSEFVPYIGIDNRKAVFEITMYLGELGHRPFFTLEAAMAVRRQTPVKQASVTPWSRSLSPRQTT